MYQKRTNIINKPLSKHNLERSEINILSSAFPEISGLKIDNIF